MQTVKPGVLKHMVKQVAKFLYPQSVSIPVWQSHTGRHIAPNEFTHNDDICTMHLGDWWKAGYDDVRWFAADLTVPAAFAGKKVYLQLDFGGEAIVRIDGKIVGAVSSMDSASWVHRDIILLPALQDGQTLHIELENSVCCGGFCDPAMDGAKDMPMQMRTAALKTVDEYTEEYYFLVTRVYDSLDLLHDEVVRTKVYNALDDSLHILDFDFDNETFYRSVPTALQTLKNRLADIKAHNPGDVYMCGHSHLDVAWLWTVLEITRKTARTFSNNLALMDKYPDFRFAQSQAVLYDFMKKHYPDIFERVKEKVKNGQWAITGNTWVEADTNLASGESLIRQLLFGRNFFLEEFGVSSDIYWLPDCFGFTWALPQIIRRFGMKYFITAKLQSNDTQPFPQSVFRWKAHSGDEVLAYVQNVHYEGEFDPRYVYNTHHTNRQKTETGVSFGMFGYGDGGGGCTFDMLESAKAIAQIPGMPAVKQELPDAFFKRAEQAYDELPVWDGELYYENHRGTFTSQSFVKKNNRKGEILLRNAEMTRVLAQITNGLPYPQEKLEETWKLLLINQFHDILPGTSIHEVYENTKLEYEKMNADGNEILNTALQSLASCIDGEDGDTAVFNFLPWEVTAPVTDEYGTFTATVPACGYRVYKKHERPAPLGGVKADKTYLENRFLRVEIDQNGLLTSIFDKENDRELLRSPNGNLLTVFQDKPIHESAWNLELNIRKKYWELTKADSIELVENTEQSACIRIERSFNKSRIVQEIRLTDTDRFVQFDTFADWQETEKTLKTAFDLNIRSTRATYEIAHGSIERPTHMNTSYDRAKFENCAHKWVDLSEGDYGVSLLNECKYGHDIENSLLRLTLLRSPNCPDRTADKGEHEFSYRLYPHAGTWQDAQTVVQANIFNTPLCCVKLHNNTNKALPSEYSFIHVDRTNLVLDAVKTAEDGNGYILRVYEAHGTRGKAEINLGFDFKSVTECNLCEEDETAAEKTGNGFKFRYRPNEVKTFRITF
ncbi:MAG: alpha-mannosidase [Ruminococcaceae bacterium]|nr:alpha-mannosidase [Oscillospiraceae bacterium]